MLIETVVHCARTFTIQPSEFKHMQTNHFRALIVVASHPIHTVTISDATSPFRLIVDNVPLHHGWGRFGCLRFEPDGNTAISRTQTNGKMHDYLSGEQNACCFDPSYVGTVYLELRTLPRDTLTVTVISYNVLQNHDDGTMSMMFT